MEFPQTKAALLLISTDTTAVTIRRRPRPLRLANGSDCRKKLENPLLDQEDRSLALGLAGLHGRIPFFSLKEWALQSGEL